MSATSDTDKERLAKELAEARKELLAGIKGLTGEQMTQPRAVGEWSVKDVLSHVTSWEEFALPHTDPGIGYDWTVLPPIT